MSSILSSLRNTLTVGFILALLLMLVSFITTSGSIDIGEGFKYNPFGCSYLDGFMLYLE